MSGFYFVIYSLKEIKILKSVVFCISIRSSTMLIIRVKLLFLFFATCYLTSYAQKITTFQKTFGTDKDDYGSAIVQLPDKGFLIAGTTGTTTTVYNPLKETYITKFY